MDEPSQPTIYILAGPNGAGKTTFANSLLPKFVNCREFLNADPIAEIEGESKLVLVYKGFERVQLYRKDAPND
jgi:ABC-type branched-subunit amino acid transport system ATPase component